VRTGRRVSHAGEVLQQVSRELIAGRENVNAFNGKLISTFAPDRDDRVFVVSEEVFFIQIGGQGLGRSLAIHFGLLGGLVHGAIEKRSKAKREEKIRNLDLVHPSGHISSGKHNFHATILDVESSELQPRARFAGHGGYFGRRIFKLRGQKAMTVELQTADDMQRAYDLLPGAISVHTNKVVWNAAKAIFAAPA
jgi:hypothetical protein